MTRLPSLKARQVIRVLESIGFERIRQSGSHVTFRHPDGRWTIVSVHPGKMIPRGTLRKIIRDTGLTVEEFLEKL
ncbi:MAG: type II toxin-antitoxin system HicA family toxin [Chloroflexi bacterium]|nr:MAG: type II toxin-antitoxin system HicA family toxin [Chloroflexota bacterium]